MRIVADENIAALDESFGQTGELVTVAGRQLDRHLLDGADALIVRSVTRVDAQLLQGTPVRFVGSCTIGTDHVDLEYLARHNIRFAHAPGCNAQAVAEYVSTALFLHFGDLPQWRHKRVGIVGYGNVGRALARILDVLGVAWVAYDPLIECQRGLGTFDDVLACDVVSLHAPLTREGQHATYHWFDQTVLDRLAPGALLVNAARGAIVANTHLKQRLQGSAPFAAALDVFENEPAIDVDLLQHLALATPHIAGYSVQGKEQGTRMVLEALCRWRGVAVPAVAGAAPITLDCTGAQTVREVVLRAYDLVADDAALRHASSADMPRRFDQLRKHYRSRHEWANQRLVNTAQSNLGAQALEHLQSMGFVL